MRWLWFVLSVLCFAVAFRTHSMGLAAVTLLGALGFLLMGTLALASSRVEANARDASSLIGPEELLRLKEIERRRQEAAGGVPPADIAAAAPDDDGAGGTDGRS